MKNLFNNISQEEKQRILEMHKGAKMVFGEQAVTNTKQPPTQQVNQAIFLRDNNKNDIMIHDGKNWVYTGEAKDLIDRALRNLQFKIPVGKDAEPEQLNALKNQLTKGIYKTQSSSASPATRLDVDPKLSPQTGMGVQSTDLRQVIFKDVPANTQTTPPAGT